MTIASTRPDIITPPASVFIPAGATGATFPIATVPVSSAQRLSIDLGTPFENFRAPRAWVTIVPQGTTPGASIESLTLAADHVAGGSTTSGTVRLTAPAPAGGAVIRLSGAADGHGMVPASITIPAGGDERNLHDHVVSRQRDALRADSGDVPHERRTAREASRGESRQRGRRRHADAPRVCRKPIRRYRAVTMTGTVQLVAPAPAGGAAVTITSQNPSVVQCRRP